MLYMLFSFVNYALTYLYATVMSSHRGLLVAGLG